MTELKEEDIRDFCKASTNSDHRKIMALHKFGNLTVEDLVRLSAK